MHKKATHFGLPRLAETVPSNDLAAQNVASAVMWAQMGLTVGIERPRKRHPGSQAINSTPAYLTAISRSLGNLGGSCVGIELVTGFEFEDMIYATYDPLLVRAVVSAGLGTVGKGARPSRKAHRIVRPRAELGGTQPSGF